MKRPLSLFFAGRYLHSKRKINFVSIISFLSVGGITLGVAALIIVLAIFNGFAGMVRSFLVSFEPHLRIETTSEESAEILANMKNFLDSSDLRDRYTPFVEGKTAVISDREECFVAPINFQYSMCNDQCSIEKPTS